MATLLLDSTTHKAAASLIDACSTLFIPYILKDVDIRISNDLGLLEKWEAQKKKAIKKNLPTDLGSLKLLEQQIFTCSGLGFGINLKELFDSKTPNEQKNKSRIYFLNEHLSGELEKQRDLILAITLDNIANTISNHFDSNLFEDENYILNLIETKNKGYPLLFAGFNVKDNPNVVFEAYKKATWYFDMGSDRLRKLSLNHKPLDILKKDMARFNLEKDLPANLEITKNKINKI